MPRLQEQNMSLLLEAEPSKPGLRERKKAKTRTAIQDHALRLFAEQGYEATTIEQIADAAEVSPSTFFRYFPTKEDVVMYDALDPLLLAAWEAQPAELSPVGALRATMRDVFGGAPADVLALQDERAELIFSVPELRMRMLDELVRSMHLFTDIAARRAGKPADDPAVQALAGAVIGVGIATWVATGGLRASDYMRQMDEGLAELEAGFPSLSQR
jgi:AcrR family transcriptional regulator